jgi:hypothetical protein
MSEWYLSGLNGGNPLAFLAALGTLRSMSLAWPYSRVLMRWEVSDGAWRPYIKTSETIEQESLIPALHEQLQRMVDHPAFAFGKDLAMDAAEFRDVAIRAQDQAKYGDSYFADFVAAFACEAVVVGKGAKPNQIQDTALRTMSGAGHQHFIAFMAQLAKETTEEHLRETLFSMWTYSDPKPSMRWDPVDDRRHALRWKEPTRDEIQTVRGANRLAIEALPLLPVMPVGKYLETTGFSQRRGEGVQWTWPIWERPLGVDTVRSLLALRALQQLQPPRGQLRTVGVVEIYRSQRITQDKRRNFTPAVPV